MPCTDGGPSYEQVQRDKELARNIPAALCAILTALEDDRTPPRVVAELLVIIDWDEAGLSREWLDDWWAQHKEQDNMRKQDERNEAVWAKAREKVLIKLTKKERLLLGVHE